MIFREVMEQEKYLFLSVFALIKNYLVLIPIYLVPGDLITSSRDNLTIPWSEHHLGSNQDITFGHKHVENPKMWISTHRIFIFLFPFFELLTQLGNSLALHINQAPRPSQKQTGWWTGGIETCVPTFYQSWEITEKSRCLFLFIVASNIYIDVEQKSVHLIILNPKWGVEGSGGRVVLRAEGTAFFSISNNFQRIMLGELGAMPWLDQASSNSCLHSPHLRSNVKERFLFAVLSSLSNQYTSQGAVTKSQ